MEFLKPLGWGDGKAVFKAEVYEEVENMLANSKTELFYDAEVPTLIDFELYPFLARMPMLRGSPKPFHDAYVALDFESKFPHIMAFVKNIQSRKELEKAITTAEPHSAQLDRLLKAGHYVGLAVE